MAEPIGALRVDLSASSAKFNKDLGKARKSLGGLKGTFKQIAVTAAGFATAFVGFHAISRGFSALSGAIIGTNRVLEDAELQFSTLIGSAEEARKHVKDLFAFAAKTPFETGPIIEASRQLLVFGFKAEDATKNLTLVGDAAAVSGRGIQEVAMWYGRAYSAIQSGRPFGEAAMRLQEMGVLSAVARNEIEALQKSGASTTVVWGRLEQEFKEHAGTMVRMSKTWGGLVSTIKDNVNLAISTAFKPFFEQIKAILGIMADLVQTDEFTKWAESIAGTIKNALVPSVILLFDSFRFVGRVVGFVTKSFRGLDLALGKLQVIERRVAALFSFGQASKHATDEADALQKMLTKQVMAYTSADAAQAELSEGLERLRSKLIGAASGGMDNYKKSTDAAKQSTSGLTEKVEELVQVMPGIFKPLSQVAAEQAPFEDAFGGSLVPVVQEKVDELIQVMPGIFQPLSQIAAEQAPFASAFEHDFNLVKEKAETDFLPFWMLLMNGLGTTSQATIAGISAALVQMVGLTGKAAEMATSNLAGALQYSMGILKKAFGENKAFAMAIAIVEGAVAIQKAWSSLPFPFNLPVVALTAAAVAVQIATIASTDMAAGGIVTGETFARIGEGRHDEMVLPLTDRNLERLGGPRQQVIQVFLDSREIAKSMVQGIPDLVRVQAAMGRA